MLLDWHKPDIWGKFTIRKILKASQCPLLDVDELPLLPPFPPLLQLLQADSVGVREPQRAQRSCRGCCQLSRSSSYQVSWAQWPLSPRHGWRVLDQPLWLLCHGAGASAQQVPVNLSSTNKNQNSMLADHFISIKSHKSSLLTLSTSSGSVPRSAGTWSGSRPTFATPLTSDPRTLGNLLF